MGNGPAKEREQTLILWVKELNSELCPDEQWKTLREEEQAWGDTKAFTIQSVDRADSIAPAACYCLPFVLVSFPGFNLSLAEDRLSLFIETYEKYSLYT